jgi:hypothetical protein
MEMEDEMEARNPAVADQMMNAKNANALARKACWAIKRHKLFSILSIYYSAEQPGFARACTLAFFFSAVDRNNLSV